LTPPPWNSLPSIASYDDNLIQVLHRDDSSNPPRLVTSLYLYKENKWLSLADTSPPSKLAAHCNAAKLMLIASQDKLHVYSYASYQMVPLHLVLDGLEDIISLETISCEAGSMSSLATTSKLGSSVIKVTESSISVGWTSEDGLSTVSSAIILDTGVTLQSEQSSIANKLNFMARLEAQATTSLNILSHLAVSETRDDDFGFVKVAILMSQKLHCIWAIPTSGENRGTVAWKLDLPGESRSHTLVHGTVTSQSMVHGINGGTHTPHVLVLSFVENSTKWYCLDVVTGSIHTSGSIDAPTSIVQVIPFSGNGICLQKAVLIHHDRSISFIPNDEATKKVISDELHKTQNGFYGHIVDRERNRIEAFTLLNHQSSFHYKLVGLTNFAGEKIVKLAYPKRDEVIQSPCTVVGDGSILLKYLNPHIAVVISVVTDPVHNQNDDPMVAAIRLKQTNSGVKKPKGVTEPGDLTAKSQNEDPSNIFVNVIDTVSGRVLHRVGHSNAAQDVDIPVLINENWIIYAIFNNKSRRTELGVLTLYEGMIDKAGITAFTSPEQVLSFSSLDPRESRPVVLSKTYTIVKPVTALGVTATRAGISTQQILISTADDRILSVSRQILEPRRPTGKEKPHEKEEGLIQYHPLVPLTTLSSPTYNQTIQGVTSIISTPTALESQSLILAFGGPDIFFARISPSNGFDLLPESFSRVLLSSVVVALLVVFLVVKRMSERKAILQSWA
jgi:ER membrane protein complex subunit 1, C-terminal